VPIWNDWLLEEGAPGKPGPKYGTTRKRLAAELEAWHSEYKETVARARAAREAAISRGAPAPPNISDAKINVVVRSTDPGTFDVRLGPARHRLKVRFAPGFRRGHAGHMWFESRDGDALTGVAVACNTASASRGFEQFGAMVRSTMDALVNAYFEDRAAEHSAEMFATLHRASSLSGGGGTPVLSRNASADDAVHDAVAVLTSASSDAHAAGQSRHQTATRAFTEVWGADVASGAPVSQLRRVRRILRAELAALQDVSLTSSRQAADLDAAGESARAAAAAAPDHAAAPTPLAALAAASTRGRAPQAVLARIQRVRTGSSLIRVRDVSQLFRWQVELCFQPDDGAIGASLSEHRAKHGGSGTVRVELRFPAAFPACAPEVRVIGPVFVDFSGPVVNGAIATSMLYSPVAQGVGVDASRVQRAALGPRVAAGGLAAAAAAFSLASHGALSGPPPLSAASSTGSDTGGTVAAGWTPVVVPLLLRVHELLRSSGAAVDAGNPHDYPEAAFRTAHARFSNLRSPGGGGRRDYSAALSAWSFSCAVGSLGADIRVPDEFHSGNKVLTPDTIDVHTGGGSRVLEIVPRSKGSDLPRITFPCGFHSPIAPKGTVVLPDHLMRSLGLQEGQDVIVRTVELPKISRVVLRPHTRRWVDDCPVPFQPFLRTAITRWACLSAGEVITLRVTKGDFAYRRDYAIHGGAADDHTATFTVAELAPDVPSAKIWTGFATDLKYSFAPALDDPEGRGYSGAGDAGAGQAGTIAWDVPAAREAAAEPQSDDLGKIGCEAGEEATVAVRLRLLGPDDVAAWLRAAGKDDLAACAATSSGPGGRVVLRCHAALPGSALYRVASERGAVRRPEPAASEAAEAFGRAATAGSGPGPADVAAALPGWALVVTSGGRSHLLEDGAAGLAASLGDASAGDGPARVSVRQVFVDRLDGILSGPRAAAAAGADTPAQAAARPPAPPAELVVDVVPYLGGAGPQGRHTTRCTLPPGATGKDLHSWASSALRLGSSVPFELRLVPSRLGSPVSVFRRPGPGDEAASGAGDEAASGAGGPAAGCDDWSEEPTTPVEGTVVVSRGVKLPYELGVSVPNSDRVALADLGVRPGRPAIARQFLEPLRDCHVEARAAARAASTREWECPMCCSDVESFYAICPNCGSERPGGSALSGMSVESSMEAFGAMQAGLSHASVDPDDALFGAPATRLQPPAGGAAAVSAAGGSALPGPAQAPDASLDDVVYTYLVGGRPLVLSGRNDCAWLRQIVDHPETTLEDLEAIDADTVTGHPDATII